MQEFLNFIFSILAYCVNIVIWLFASILNLVFSFLPNSPFLGIVNSLDSSIGDFIPYMNWFIPVSQMLGVLTLWLSCMLIYYVYSVVMRWIKLID